MIKKKLTDKKEIDKIKRSLKKKEALNKHVREGRSLKTFKNGLD